MLRSGPAVYLALISLGPGHSRPNHAPDPGHGSPSVPRARRGGRSLIPAASCRTQPNLSRRSRRRQWGPGSPAARSPRGALTLLPVPAGGQEGRRPRLRRRLPDAAPSGGTKGTGRPRGRGGGSGRGRKVGEAAGLAEGTGRASAGRAAHAAVNGRLAGGGGGRAAGEFQELEERAAAGVAERPDSGPRRSCRRRRRRAGAQLHPPSPSPARLGPTARHGRGAGRPGPGIHQPWPPR